MTHYKNFKQGDIVLVPFPYTNLTGVKRRPCLIVSNKHFPSRDDFLIVAITANKLSAGKKHDIKITNDDLVSGKIPKTSYIKPYKLFCVSKYMFIRTIGRVQTKVFKDVVDQIKYFIA